jgi:hypothetical protein
VAQASQGPHRSVLDVSHVLDGFLLHRPLRVCFAPLPRPGFALRGLPLSHSRTSSSLAVALLAFTLAPCRRLPSGASDARPSSGPCSVCQSVVPPWGFSPRPARSLPELPLPRVLLRVPRGRPFLDAPSAHGLSRPSAFRRLAA